MRSGSEAWMGKQREVRGASHPSDSRPPAVELPGSVTSIPSAWNILHVVALLVFQVSAERSHFSGRGVCGGVVYDEGCGDREEASGSQGLVICNPTTVQLLFCHRFLLAPNFPSVLLAVSSSRVL